MTLASLDLETACRLVDQNKCAGKGECYQSGHALNPKTSKITCIGLYTPKDQWVFRGENMLADLSYILNINDYQIIGHNLFFDLKQLHFSGFKINQVNWTHDTQVMAHVFTEKVSESFLTEYEIKREEANKSLPTRYSHRKAGALSLKCLAPYFLGIKPFWEDPTNHDSDEYVLRDCEYTYKLYEFLDKYLKKYDQFNFYKEQMMNWARFLLDISLKGISIHMDTLNDKEQELFIKEQAERHSLNKYWELAHKAYRKLEEDKLKNTYHDKFLLAFEKSKNKEKEDKIRKRYNTLFNAAKSKLPDLINYDSPKQMLWLLRDYLKVPVVNFQGEESTGVEVLESLAATGRDDIKKFLDWRQTKKLLTSFIPSYKEFEINSVIHTDFKLTGTRTGRLSASSPNLQQIPPEMLKLFKPRPNHKFIIYDMEAIEAKLIAAYSGDPMLYDIIQKGHSIHDYNTKVFFNLDSPIEEIKKKYPNERQASKTVGFALFYGAGSGRIKASFISAGYPVNERAAKEKLENFREYYRDAISFHREITTKFENGDIILNVLGRPLKINNPEDAYMKGFNTLIQSSASDLNLQAAYLSQQEYVANKLQANVLVLVHDCIIVEAHNNDLEQAEIILKTNMTKKILKSINGDIPLTISGGIRDGWTKD